MLGNIVKHASEVGFGVINGVSANSVLCPFIAPKEDFGSTGVYEAVGASTSVFELSTLS
jgi:hypothetical protein